MIFAWIALDEWINHGPERPQHLGRRNASR